MKFLTFITALIPTLLPIVLCLILYRRIYFRSITSVFIPAGSSSLSVALVRPVRSWMKQLSCGYKYGFVPLGNNFFALAVDRPTSDHDLSFLNVSFCSDVYIFKKNVLGRFVSVDISDRAFIDLISKFTK